MDEYSRDVLTRAVDGFVYVERTEQSGRVRQGLVGKIDLEAYSYEKGARPAIRPSERTVTERIPPRMAGAPGCGAGNAPRHDAGRRPGLHPHRAHRRAKERA